MKIKNTDYIKLYFGGQASRNVTWRDHKNESTDLHLLRFSLVVVFIYKRSLSTQTDKYL